MPVILDPDTYDLWLDRGMQNAGAASELLKPYDARLMRCYPVSTRINHVAHDDAACSAPVPPRRSERRLVVSRLRGRAVRLASRDSMSQGLVLEWMQTNVCTPAAGSSPPMPIGKVP
jgi:SOS response associated peptidase (SRAP)